MAEPLRRRVRRRALGALVRAPAPLARGLFGALAVPARFTRYERRTLENLELALGDTTTAAERLAIATGVRRHSARLAFEWTRLARAGLSAEEHARVLDWIDTHVELDASVEALRRAAPGGRGRLLVTAHIGNWELCAIALRRAGLEGLVVGFHKRNDSSADWMVELRRGLGVETVPQDGSPRRLLETLRAGRNVGLLADLEARRLAGEVLPFFGHPALTMTAPAALARAARAPLVPLRCIAHGKRYRLSVDAPLELTAGLPRTDAARDLTTRLNAVFERWIRETPEQWAWHQRRWRESAELARLASNAG